MAIKHTYSEIITNFLKHHFPGVSDDKVLELAEHIQRESDSKVKKYSKSSERRTKNDHDDIIR